MLPVGDRTELPPGRFPWVTLLILASNLAVFSYEVWLGDAVPAFIRAFGFVPRDLFDAATGQSAGRAYTIVTSLFVHGSVLHLAGNMIFLWVFGDNVEDALGHAAYLAFYFLCGILASVAHAAIASTTPFPAIGASGAIAGALAGYLLLFPGAIVRTVLFFGPFVSITRVAAAVLIFFWLVFQFFAAAGVWQNGSFQTGGIAFFAHIGGFAAGAVLVAAVQRARHRHLGCLTCPRYRSPVFLNWMALMAALIVLLSLGHPVTLPTWLGIGWDARRLAAAAIGALAFFDGFRRLAGRNSYLGAGHGFARWLAIVQITLAGTILFATA